MSDDEDFVFEADALEEDADGSDKGSEEGESDDQSGEKEEEEEDGSDEMA